MHAFISKTTHRKARPIMVSLWITIVGFCGKQRVFSRDLVHRNPTPTAPSLRQKLQMPHRYCPDRIMNDTANDQLSPSKHAVWFTPIDDSL
jgi:hypothetical protein